jgi:hypothetical protein
MLTEKLFTNLILGNLGVNKTTGLFEEILETLELFGWECKLIEDPATEGYELTIKNNGEDMRSAVHDNITIYYNMGDVEFDVLRTTEYGNVLYLNYGFEDFNSILNDNTSTFGVRYL